MKLKVIGNHRHALLDGDNPVVGWGIHLGADAGSLTFETRDADLAAKFVYGATLDVDLTAVQAPPEPVKAPEAEAEEPTVDAPTASPSAAGVASDPSEDPTPTPRRARR